MRGLTLLAIASFAVALVMVLTQDPEQAWAVAAVIVALGVAAGAIATVAQLRATRGARRRTPLRAVVVRRGVEIGAVVALLLWLRAIDGLSILTAAFVVGAFFVAEAIVSARPRSSR